MKLTEYHAKYYAHELTKRCSSDNLEKFAASLMDAQVDLNPHQVDAALFAFKSPLSRGAILADEVGLGKTIEAGIVLAQKWAERKRRILIIVPSSLRKQWSQELQEKFFLPSVLLESKSFNQEVKQGKRNPFEQKEIVITSYQFARNKADQLRAINWDMVVIDEAHRLRNVYKTSNKIARAIKDALPKAPKLLLTATPLQNTLMELYGLVSFIDDFTFGDQKSFRNQFARLTNDINFDELKARIAPICKRTLRRQVLEYIKYTNRIPITQEFVPTTDEQVLYDLVSEYLRRDNLQALPASQRTLMILVFRKLLASSTFAIAGALDSIINRLKAKLKDAEQKTEIDEELAEDFETLDEIKDEWEDEEEERLTTDDIEAIQSEIVDLEAFRDLAVSITENAKGKSLLSALKTGFAKAESLGASKKAIIFTESRRTQNYLVRLLSESDYQGKIVLFNGSNSDEQSRGIYQAWFNRHKDSDKVSGSRSADMRSALVDYFKEDAQIMIATEAAAEGINLQFCSLVVNYDLPWNPQRIEQRIGRCHRYGQKHDVVVVNFLNKNNAADQRVYELLAEKFALFSGVFGASDEVLGSIESGVDFEKRIVRIYQECRSPEEIQVSFDELQRELETEIDESMKLTRKKLLENFDEEVHEKLRVNLKESTDYLNKYENWLWELTRFFLHSHAEFITEQTAFNLKKNPFSGNSIPLGLYRLGRKVEDAHVYRIGHPLAQNILIDAVSKKLPESEITFDYSGHPVKISILEPLIGKCGYLTLANLTVESLDAEDYLLFSAVTDDGKLIDNEQSQRLFSLPGSCNGAKVQIQHREKLNQQLEERKNGIVGEITAKNASFFDDEMEKLDKWADDKRSSLKINLKELDDEIKELKKQARQSANLPDKLALQKKVKGVEKKRDDAWREYDVAAKEIEVRKDDLIDEVESRLKQRIESKEQFTIRWQVI